MKLKVTERDPDAFNLVSFLRGLNTVKGIYTELGLIQQIFHRKLHLRQCFIVCVVY